MINVIISFVVAIVAAVMPWTAFSKEIDYARADQLIAKYNTNIERPKSCPMESKKFSDLVVKTEALKDVLKGNCLNQGDDKLTEIMASIAKVQEDLKAKNIVDTTGISQTLAQVAAPAAAAASGTTTTTATTTTASTTVNGMQFSALFSNLSNIFKKNQCNMEDGRILQTTADLIYDSTQLGVLAGNQLGFMIAGGGFLLSSALRLIDMFFKQRFDFEKAVDRQTFVKLNCSFFEIRRELDMNGALDIENNTSREDYRDIKAIIDDMTAEFKAMDEEKANLGKTHSEIDKATFKENVADLTEFKKVINKVQKYLLPGVITPSEIPSETQKLLMISQLAQDYEQIVVAVNYYKTLKISSIPMLDDLFINDLKKFDAMDSVTFNVTMNMTAKDFNENDRAKILFHIMRINNDIVAKEMSLTDKSQKAKAERGAYLDKRKEEMMKKFVEIKKVETRLGSVVAPKEYTGLDDGSDNMVTILENHKKISAQLYGEWGDKFLKYTTYQSSDEVKDFNERLKSFHKRYADTIRLNKKENLASTYLCQDAQKLRLMFKHADSIVQEGFDFVVTNKDIIHSDVKNYYNQNLDEESSRILGSVEKVQRHYKSAVYALKSLKGETLPDEIQDRYLKKFAGSYYIGRSMLDVSAAKAKARNIQDIYERLGCQQSLANDLSN